MEVEELFWKILSYYEVLERFVIFNRVDIQGCLCWLNVGLFGGYIGV